MNTCGSLAAKNVLLGITLRVGIIRVKIESQ